VTKKLFVLVLFKLSVVLKLPFIVVVAVLVAPLPTIVTTAGEVDAVRPFTTPVTVGLVIAGQTVLVMVTVTGVVVAVGGVVVAVGGVVVAVVVVA